DPDHDERFDASRFPYSLRLGVRPRAGRGLRQRTGAGAADSALRGWCRGRQTTAPRFSPSRGRRCRPAARRRRRNRWARNHSRSPPAEIGAIGERIARRRRDRRWAWGSFTALNLRQMGAKVTLVDAYGPGNSRSTSGDESRGVRSSYGDRSESLELWMLWGRESMKRWKKFDAEWGRDCHLNMFLTTCDLIPIF